MKHCNVADNWETNMDKALHERAKPRSTCSIQTSPSCLVLLSGTSDRVFLCSRCATEGCYNPRHPQSPALCLCGTPLGRARHRKISCDEVPPHVTQLTRRARCSVSSATGRSCVDSAAAHVDAARPCTARYYSADVFCERASGRVFVAQL